MKVALLPLNAYSKDYSLALCFFNHESTGLIECLLPVFLKSRCCRIAGKMPYICFMFEEFTVAAKLQKLANYSEEYFTESSFYIN